MIARSASFRADFFSPRAALARPSHAKKLELSGWLLHGGWLSSTGPQHYWHRQRGHRFSGALSQQRPYNTATGPFALLYNTTGALDTANGTGALGANTGGNNNTANGAGALQSNIGGVANTANGTYALANNTGGSFNTADGASALPNNASGSNNIGLGVNAGSGVTTANNVICIGTNVAGADVSDSCYIGNIYGASIDPATAAAVGVDATGKLGTTVSSRRFKRDIQPMDKSSEGILALKPVTFHYKSDAKNTPCFGLITEEVAQVNPDLVLLDKNGEILTVRYDAVNAMLLNEFLKEHKKVEEQGGELQQQEITRLSALRKAAGLG